MHVSFLHDCAGDSDENLIDGASQAEEKAIRFFSRFFWFFTESWGSKQGLRRSTKSCTRKEHESATNSIAKRGQGGNSPLQGQGTAPLVGFGATPQLFRVKPTQRKKSTKGAGSEASLPVTKKPSKYSSSNMGGDRRRSPEGDRKALWNPRKRPI